MKGTKRLKKFGGRPVERKPEPGKRTHLSVAMPLPVKRRLEREAVKQERSVSREVTRRLEQSLDQQALLPDVLALAYGRQFAGLMMALGSVMSKAGRMASSVRTICGGENWIVDPHAFDQAVKAAIDILGAARPPGEPRP
jgi:hypothetical protein